MKLIATYNNSVLAIHSARVKYQLMHSEIDFLLKIHIYRRTTFIRTKKLWHETFRPISCSPVSVNIKLVDISQKAKPHNILVTFDTRERWSSDKEMVCRAQTRITPQIQIVSWCQSTNVCHVWPKHFRFVWLKPSLAVHSLCFDTLNFNWETSYFLQMGLFNLSTIHLQLIHKSTQFQSENYLFKQFFKEKFAFCCYLLVHPCAHEQVRLC